MRTIPETIAYLRRMIDLDTVDLILIDVGELTALLDRLRDVEEALGCAEDRLAGEDI